MMKEEGEGVDAQKGAARVAVAPVADSPTVADGSGPRESVTRKSRSRSCSRQPPEKRHRGRSPAKDCAMQPSVGKARSHSRSRRGKARSRSRSRRRKPPSLDNETRVIKRAVAFRMKYGGQKRKQKCHCLFFCFHRKNRDGIPPNGERADQLLKTWIEKGFSVEEALLDNIAVRVKPGDKSHIEFNLQIVRKDKYLGTHEEDWLPVAMTISHTHANQVFKNVLLGAVSIVSACCDDKSRPEVERVKEVDLDMYNYIMEGGGWELLDAEMEDEEPDAVPVIQCAQPEEWLRNDGVRDARNL